MLNKRYPTWELIKADKTSEVNFVTGLINSDAKDDFVFFITINQIDTWHLVLVAFLSTKSDKFKIIELFSASQKSQPDGYVLVKINKGESRRDGDGEIKFKTDGFELVQLGKASSAYFFKDNGFKKINTAD